MAGCSLWVAAAACRHWSCGLSAVLANWLLQEHGAAGSSSSGLACLIGLLLCWMPDYLCRSALTPFTLRCVCCCHCCSYKYIYVRSPKSASTSIVNELGECNNQKTRGHNSSTCMVLHFYWNSTELAPDNVQQMWKDYFVFGFVRNPWRRAYSLYKYLHSNGCMYE